MKGVILYFDTQTQQGAVKSVDGEQFEFGRSEWKSANEPEAGLNVDFMIKEGIAVDMYMIPSNESSYSVGQANKENITTQKVSVSTSNLNLKAGERFANLFNSGMFNLFGVISCGIIFVAMIIQPIVMSALFYSPYTLFGLFTYSYGILFPIALFILMIFFYGGMRLLYTRILGGILIVLMLLACFRDIYQLVKFITYIIQGANALGELNVVIWIFFLVVEFVITILLAIALFLAKYKSNEKTF